MLNIVEPGDNAYRLSGDNNNRIIAARADHGAGKVLPGNLWLDRKVGVMLGIC